MQRKYVNSFVGNYMRSDDLLVIIVAAHRRWTTIMKLVMSVCVCVCVSVCLSVRPSVRLSVCVSVCLLAA